ncbi:MAG: thiamine-phosphate kinase [Pyrinomonadaceae bacterium]
MISEFQFIDKLRSKYSLEKIGDDCAVLPKDADTDLLLTADLLVEDIDFRLTWTTPEFLGHKALAVSLSDIAAMGGDPKWAMLSLGVPKNLWKTDFVDQFYAGWFELANQFGVELVGGDISRSPDKLVIDSIAGGEVTKGKAIFRSGAKTGDAIYVTGSLGAAAGGLKLLEGEFEFKDLNSPSEDLIIKQLKPSPQLKVANLLFQLELATAMIDISDGLSSDLHHVCRASRIGAKINADKLPVDENLTNLFPSQVCFEMALNGGEDLELLFTVDKKNISLLKSIAATPIGKITSNTDVVELIHDGKTEILKPKGYRHF